MIYFKDKHTIDVDYDEAEVFVRYNENNRYAQSVEL